MRWNIAEIAVLVTAGLFANLGSIKAQQPSPENLPETTCPSSFSAHDERPLGPEITIAEVIFSGTLEMPIADQEQIADLIRHDTYRAPLDGLIDGGLERIREEWQNRGYFKVQVTGEARTLTSSPVSQRIALSVHIEEGPQYKLSGMAFRNNKAIKSLDLRGLFPIGDGEIFSREKIGKGLENLRKAYGELGYPNFTSVPDTVFDDENKLISLVVDFDEGKQFRIASVKVSGLEDPARQELLTTFKRGQIFNSRLWEESLLKYASMFPDCTCRRSEPRRLNERSGTVMLTLDFRPCSTN